MRDPQPLLEITHIYGSGQDGGMDAGMLPLPATHAFADGELLRLFFNFSDASRFTVPNVNLGELQYPK